MIDFSSIERCAEISDELVARAVTSRDGMRALLARASEIARPMQGAARILVALSRMATTACDWLDGELAIEIVGDEEVCVVEVTSELGGGLRERIFPTFTLHVPVDEFARAVRLVPRMVAPLQMHERGGRLLFTASQHVRRSTHPPPGAEVEQDLLTIELGAPESAPKLRARPAATLAKPPASAPKLPVAREETSLRQSAPKLPVALLEELRESSTRIPAAREETSLRQSSPRLPVSPVEELRESSSRISVAREETSLRQSSPKLPVAREESPLRASSPKLPVAVVEERVDRGSSRRIPVAAPIAEERASAKVPIVPREDDDLSGFLDDLEVAPPGAGASSKPVEPVAPAPSPKPEARAASPMLMPRLSPKPKRQRPSQKPTVERMSAIRGDELAALKPAKVPNIDYPAADARTTATRPSTRPRAAARLDGAEPRAGSEAPSTARKLASTKPPGAATPTKRPSVRASAPPTVRPLGAAAANVRDEGVDEGWDE